MRICFIFGKGIDGCGVTNGAILFEKWLRAAGHETFIIDFDNKQKMLRAKNAKFIGDVIRIQYSTTDVERDVIDRVNLCDIAIFHSYPTKKQFGYVERFRRFLQKINGPIMVMHDHGVSQQNINAIPQSGEIFSYADVLVPQAVNGYSSKAFCKFDPGLTDRIIENPIWIEPRAVDKYCRSFQDRKDQLVYVGRMSVIKDPSMLCRIEPFLPHEWECSLIGCEKSLSMFRPKDKLKKPGEVSPYISEYRDRFVYYYLGKDGTYTNSGWGHAQEQQARIRIYDSYRYDWGMEQLGKTKFSWCGYKLGDASNYGHRMEYTMIESFLLSLPIINRHFAENAYSPEGKLWKEYYGPLVAQKGEEEQLADELVSISNNRKEWEERVSACRELIYKFNDLDVLAPKFFNNVLTMGRRKNKPDPLEVIKTWFPEVREYRDRGEVVMSNPTSILTSSPMILVENKQKVVGK